MGTITLPGDLGGDILAALAEKAVSVPVRYDCVLVEGMCVCGLVACGTSRILRIVAKGEKEDGPEVEVPEHLG